MKPRILMFEIDFKKAMGQLFFADPSVTPYGTIPPIVEEAIKGIKVKPYNGFRPGWIPNTATMRDFLMDNCWGGTYVSRSRVWVIGHNGTPLSEDSIQIDHILKWEEISRKLRNNYIGKNAEGTAWNHRQPLPNHSGKLIKGIDYIDDPHVLQNHGEDILYVYTNIAAIKYYHTIENLRPLPGSINAKRNAYEKTDTELEIVSPDKINMDLMESLAGFASLCEEYTTQVVHELEGEKDELTRETLAKKFIEITSELSETIRQNSGGYFI